MTIQQAAAHPVFFVVMDRGAKGVDISIISGPTDVEAVIHMAENGQRDDAGESGPGLNGRALYLIEGTDNTKFCVVDDVRKAISQRGAK
ncbi:hypothetical protein [Belnapia sp. F-4-1]|uniref:hypothetical protein n=1 Tax=Belnapia sp. F-4-1 TaxID=1545443 RepID=UPI0005BDAA48|nr:hypothetical protein [Belnapia sp. F-4-1]